MMATLDTLLREACVPSAGGTPPLTRLDAELLLCHVLSRPRSFLHARPELTPDAAAVERFRALLQRRRAGEPLAYITGEREFWSVALKLNRDTLIPRPETETLVEQALIAIPVEANWTVADLGTGSGAIGLAIASERPRCRVIATDVSPAALDVARANASALGLRNVEFRHGSWVAPLGDLTCELIVSNPPYIAEQDAHLAAPELSYEPHRALVAGPSGLEALAAIAAAAPARLVAGGSLMLEHGYDQREPLASLLADAGYENIRCYRDLSGNDRVTAARRPEREGYRDG
ncbi:MAG TPA: peptide chain release factor N(5)-glutamine methyltransferase [Gammaproteobacteria bacterium]|nr:peptide chain release factor N(5)-glutamine methyltransferase [Gammaproteobacteria bacterium]